jgi:heme O synthase-like polyprenyltransferase
MGLNFNVNLPGPFSYSARMPSATKAVRAGAAAVREDRERRAAMEREVPRPVARNERMADDEYWVAVILGALVVMIVLAVALY